MGVDRGHPALDEFDSGAVEDFRDVVVCEFLTGGDLMHPQPLGEAGRRVDQGDRHVHFPGAPSQSDRGQHAGVAGAEDDDAVRGGGHCGSPCRWDVHGTKQPAPT
ncbi:hypothetical protein ACFWVM_32230 [Nocardia fluminea]|uniref:hypothetical protein n=1 Tax=Nocardia fluminea TaxID=134984 RepID=UPI00364C3BD0